MIATFPSISLEYVWVPVTAAGDDADLLTTLPVEMAFLMNQTSEPQETDWADAEWSDNTARPVARCLIGPGSVVVLPDGVHWVWVRVSGGTERPVRQAGKIRIT